MESVTGNNNSSKPQIKIWVLVSATGLGAFLASLDGTIVFIGLKTIRDSLGVSQNAVQWVILSYLLTMIAFSTIAGDLGDRFSNKLIFQIGMAIFSLASLLCFFAKTLLALIIFRVLQGIGATGLVANGMAIITRFTTKQNRGLAIGLNSLIIALALSIGPILGGVITVYLRWGWIFLINVPIGLAGLFWVQVIIPKTPPIEEKRRKADVLGSTFLALFLFLMVFSFSIFASIFDEVSLFGSYTATWSVICLGMSILCLIAFVLWERKTENPLVDLSMFKNRRFAVGIFSAIFAYLGLCVIIFQLPLFVQDVLGLSQIETGLIILGTPIAMAITAVISGYLSGRIDAKYITTLGIGIMTLSLVFGAVFTRANVKNWVLVIIAIIIGIALGAFIAPNNTSVMSSSPENKLGVANGMLSLSTNFGFSLGTALATSVFIYSQNFFKRKIGVIFEDPANLFVFSQNSFQRRIGIIIENPVTYVAAMKVLFAVFAVFMFFSTIFSYFRGPDPFKRREKMKKRN